MPVCRKCDSSFPNWAEVDGKKRNLQKRKFCLECSPFGSHNTKVDVDFDAVASRRQRQKDYVMKKRQEIAQKAIDYKGGKCIVCGYNRCNRALEFHHLNPEEKEFAITDAYTMSWDKVQNELDKCVLLCANCHREVEDGMIAIIAP